jgi:DNA-binding XRE family transcriptional regulator
MGADAGPGRPQPGRLCTRSLEALSPLVWADALTVAVRVSASSLSDTSMVAYRYLFVYRIALQYRQNYNKVMEVDAVKLRELRKSRVLSMRELESLSGVSYNTIWRLENGLTGGQPRTIRKLAKTLGVEAAELLK